MSDLLDNRYEVLGRLGSGGMAEVFRGLDSRLGREVAIKFLALRHSRDPRVADRFRQEVATLAQFSHPNVVTIHDGGETPNHRLYLVMERLHGETLDRTLRTLQQQGEVLALARFVAIARQLCRALRAAHARSIVHRDIKPSNIFLCSHGDGDEDHDDDVKLLDFGIAKALGLAPESSRPGDEPLTELGAFIGTPHYAAPEMIAPEKFGEPDTRADVFSLGIVFYQCVTGTLPFAGFSRHVVINKTALEPVPPPSDHRRLPEALDAIIRKATALHPGERYSSVRELAADLKRFEASLVKAVGFVDVGATDPWTEPQPADTTTHVRSRPENAVDPATHGPKTSPPPEAMTTSESEGRPAPSPPVAGDVRASRASIAATVVTASLAIVVVSTMIFMPKPPEKNDGVTDVGAEIVVAPPDHKSAPQPAPIADASTTAPETEDATQSSSTGDTTTTTGSPFDSQPIPEAPSWRERQDCAKELETILKDPATKRAVQECLFEHDLTAAPVLRLITGETGRCRLTVNIPTGATANRLRARSCIEGKVALPLLRCSITGIARHKRY